MMVTDPEVRYDAVPDRLTSFIAAGHSAHGTWSHKGCHSIPSGTDLLDYWYLMGS